MSTALACDVGEYMPVCDRTRQVALVRFDELCCRSVHGVCRVDDERATSRQVGGGGGAGGSVWIVAKAITGVGLISANGGSTTFLNSTVTSPGGWVGGGGGGGGDELPC